MSAIAYVLPDKYLVQIKANLFLYGSQATQDILLKILQEINTMWNGPDAVIQIDNAPFQIEFEINGVVVEEDDIPLLTAHNRDFKNNFVRIEKENRLTRSMMGMRLGDNSGHWISTDNLGESTTAAHEFGHALGLPHPKQLDYRDDKLPPPIMAPRGSLVDTEYQWSPSAKPGEPGGTMKPIFRKVRTSEILAIFNSKDLKNQSVITLGILSNTIYDQMANPLKIT